MKGLKKCPKSFSLNSCYKIKYKVKAVESQYHTIFQNYAKKSTLDLSFVLSEN